MVGDEQGSGMVRQVASAVVIITVLLVNAPAVGERDRTELRAITLLRAIQTTEANHFANHGYYDTLQCLASEKCVGPVSGGAASYQGLISADVASLKDYNGYTLHFFAGRRSDVLPKSPLATPLADFAMVLVPKGEAGRHAMCGDRTGRIYLTPGTRMPRVREGRCLETSRVLN
jgi:hypothetical protein